MTASLNSANSPSASQATSHKLARLVTNELVHSTSYKLVQSTCTLSNCIAPKTAYKALNSKSEAANMYVRFHINITRDFVDVGAPRQAYCRSYGKVSPKLYIQNLWLCNDFDIDYTERDAVRSAPSEPHLLWKVIACLLLLHVRLGLQRLLVDFLRLWSLITVIPKNASLPAWFLGG